MTIESSYGFRSAQSAFENASPYDDECECPQLFQCQRCDEVTSTPGPLGSCPDKACIFDAAGDEDAPLPQVVPIDREDSTEGALQSCPRHGWCGGCSSRNCEDCNG